MDVSNEMQLFVRFEEEGQRGVFASEKVGHISSSTIENRSVTNVYTATRPHQNQLLQLHRCNATNVPFFHSLINLPRSKKTPKLLNATDRFTTIFLFSGSEEPKPYHLCQASIVSIVEWNGNKILSCGCLPTNKLPKNNHHEDVVGYGGHSRRCRLYSHQRYTTRSMQHTTHSS